MPSIIECITIVGLAGLGIGLKIIIGEEKVRGLRDTTFRGAQCALAGNNSRWNEPLEMVRDPDFIERFGNIVVASLAENRLLIDEGFVERVTIPFEGPVGWVTSLPREKINGARIAPRRISDRLRGMVVDPGDVEHPAPLTNLLTVEFTARRDFKDPGRIAIRITEVTIGEDFGDITGDLTSQFRRAGELTERKVVFFLPHHAGGSEYVPLDP